MLEGAQPPKVRITAQQGTTAVMRAEWRDPTDTTPSAVRIARTISGYRTFCPLRRVQRQYGSQVTERHVYAADKLRIGVDVAAIGRTSSRDWLHVNAITYGPRLGPSINAEKQARAAHEVARVFRRLTSQQRIMAIVIVLRNKSLARWCQEAGAGSPHVAMGRLLALLDFLEKHYSAEIDRDAARDAAPA